MSADLKPATFRIDRELLEALTAIKRRTGAPISEQVRRALRAWLDANEVKSEKADRRRGISRKRS